MLDKFAELLSTAERLRVQCETLGGIIDDSIPDEILAFVDEALDAIRAIAHNMRALRLSLDCDFSIWPRFDETAAT